jgi:undecaprenyl-diphosphatase
MLHELDIELFRVINGAWTCGLMDRIGVALQHPWWLWLPLAFAIAWAASKEGREGWWFIVVAAAVIAFGDILCSVALKPLIARPRPSLALDGVRALVGRKSSWSMPSNHAANTAAAAVLIARRWPRWMWPAALATLLVGYSRVYVGAHYPSDVLAGWAIGVALGAAASAWLERRSERLRPSSADCDPARPSDCG